MESTKLKYVHVNSEHRYDHDGTNSSKFKLMLTNHPLKNVKRVAVKQFTMANTVFNIRKSNQRLEWFEFYYTTDLTVMESVHRYVDIPVGTYTTTSVVTKINELITALGIHSFGSDDSGLNITLTSNSIEENYTVTVSAMWVKTENASTAGKYKAFIIGSLDSYKYSVWNDLGFTREQQLNQFDHRKIRVNVDLTQELNVRDSEAILTKRRKVITSSSLITGTVEEDTNIFTGSGSMTGNHPSTFETVPGLYLTSDSLTNGNCYETRINQITQTTNAVPVNILEWIQFDQPRFATVHYDAQMPHWHYLDTPTLHEFDIQLRTADGSLYEFGEINKFNMVLVFETVEIHPDRDSLIRQYGQEGYDKAHTPERINWSKLSLK